MNKAPVSGKILKRVLSYDWWKYVCFILGIPLVSYYCSYFKNRIKPEEEIQIFFMSNLKENSTFKDDIYENLKEKVVGVTYYKPIDDDSTFNDVLINQGYGNSDLLILKSDAIKDSNLQYIVKLDQALKDRFLSIKPNCEFYEKNDSVYGIKIMDQSNDTYNSTIFNDYFEKDNSYYILFSKESHNIGTYGKNSSHDEAFEVVDFLLGNNG